MSRESIIWLNTNTLGFTSRRGTAWHWRAEEHGDTSNHYPNASLARSADPGSRRTWQASLSHRP